MIAGLRRFPRQVFTLICLIMSVGAVSIYVDRHFRFPSLADTFPNGELIIAIDAGYPPFGDIANDSFVGLDIDLGKALAEHLGLTPRFVMVNFDSAYDAVKTGTAHVSLAGLRVDNTRTADVNYTWGYLNDGVMLVSQKHIPDGWMLGAQTVGVELGSASHTEARKWSRRVKNLQIVTYATPDEALNALTRAHTVNAVLMDSISIRHYLRENPETRLDATYLTADFYAGAVRNDRRDVLYQLNIAMLALLNNGAIDALLNAHLGREPAMIMP